MLPIVQLENKGLYTFNNLLSQVPPGAMTIANNIVVDRPGIAETRRGFEFYGNKLPSAALKGFIYRDTLLWYCTAGELVHDTGSGVWSTYSGSFFPPTNNFVNSTQASGNFFFTTNNGVYKLDSLTGTPRQAGVPPALDLEAALAGVGSAVPTNSQVAYALVWAYTDANGNLILGAPSAFFNLINNSGSTQNVTITASIPVGITTSYFAQLYRTPNTGSATIVPGNNLQLAVEYTPTAGDITAGFVTITDTIPDTLLGAALYTDDGQPFNFPNTPPPLALDIATFQGMTFYANFTTLQQMFITLDAVGAPLGIQVGDTITLTDTNSSTAYVYTGAAANNFATRAFKVDTSGSIAFNIDATARNIVQVINRDPNNTLWYAYYTATETSLPGGIQLTARNLQSGTFYINSSRQTCWTPVIPAAGNAYISGNTSSPNSLLVSKVNQPEAVPVAFLLPISTGQTSIVIYRIIPLQDALYAFTNGGVFRISGSEPTSLQVLLFDSSAILVGLQTPVILNNSIFYFSTQAICNVSSGGNQIMSRNVERDLLTLSVLGNFTSLAYGVPYESDRKYMLFTPSAGADTSAQESYVYNWITQAFTLWTRPCSAAIVSPATQKLYVTNVNRDVFQERKAFTNNDYADESYTVSITSTDTSANTITLVSSANVTIGDIIQQTVGADQFSTQVLGNNLLTNVLTVRSAVGFAAGSAIDYHSIMTRIQYAPVTCGFAEYLKKFLSWQFMFENPNFTTLPVQFTSDLFSQQEQVNLVPISTGGWGTFPWGTLPWGVSAASEQLIPTWGTPNTIIAHWVVIDMSLTQAFTSLALNGISATFDILSTRGH